MLDYSRALACFLCGLQSSCLFPTGPTSSWTLADKPTARSASHGVRWEVSRYPQAYRERQHHHHHHHHQRFTKPSASSLLLLPRHAETKQKHEQKRPCRIKKIPVVSIQTNYDTNNRYRALYIQNCAGFMHAVKKAHERYTMKCSASFYHHHPRGRPPPAEPIFRWARRATDHQLYQKKRTKMHVGTKNYKNTSNLRSSSKPLLCVVPVINKLSYCYQLSERAEGIICTPRHEGKRHERCTPPIFPRQQSPAFNNLWHRHCLL